MKKLVLLITLLTTMLSQGQFRLGDTEYFTTSLTVDPSASIKEKGIDFAGEIEVASYWKYAKFNIQVFPELEGGYLDATGGFGVNVTSGYFNQWRGYGGIRLGVINREKYIYPLFGYEGGVDYYISPKTFIKVRGTGDWRSDMMYSDADEKMVYSLFFGIGRKF